jgi:pimeloyl-ACP methyl ester carboxylesterase
MVLTGPLTGPIRFDWAGFFSAEEMRELAETGRVTTDGRGEVQRKVVVEGQMLQEFEKIDQPSVLAAVNCPVLIIHGDDDEDERLLLEQSQQGMPFLPRESRLEVLRGANHGFRDHYDQVIRLTLAWLRKHASAHGASVKRSSPTDRTQRPAQEDSPQPGR